MVDGSVVLRVCCIERCDWWNITDQLYVLHIVGRSRWCPPHTVASSDVIGGTEQRGCTPHSGKKSLVSSTYRRAHLPTTGTTSTPVTGVRPVTDGFAELCPIVFWRAGCSRDVHERKIKTYFFWSSFSLSIQLFAVFCCENLVRKQPARRRKTGHSSANPSLPVGRYVVRTISGRRVSAGSTSGGSVTPRSCGVRSSTDAAMEFHRTSVSAWK